MMDKRILIVAALMGMAILACGQGPTPAPTYTPYPTYTPIPTPKASFGPVTFAQDVTEDDEPIKPGSTFPAGTTEVYAIFDYSGMSDGMEWEHKWYHEGEERVPKVDIWEGGESGTWWATFYNEDGLSPGNWKLELHVEGQLLQSGTFVIEEEAKVPSFGSMTFAKGVTEDDKPTGATNIFPAGTTEVYAIFDYSGMEDGMEYISTWYYEGELDVTDTWEWDFGEEGTHWIRYYNDAGLASGSYRLELYIAGELAQSGSMTIAEAKPTPTPTKAPPTPTATQVPPTPTQPSATTATLKVINWTGMRVGFFINATQYFIEPNSTLTLELPPGRYPYTISRTGYSPARGVVELEAGRTFELSITAEVG